MSSLTGNSSFFIQTKGSYFVQDNSSQDALPIHTNPFHVFVPFTVPRSLQLIHLIPTSCVTFSKALLTFYVKNADLNASYRPTTRAFLKYLLAATLHTRMASSPSEPHRTCHAVVHLDAIKIEYFSTVAENHHQLIN